jgi:hypothetical protein
MGGNRKYRDHADSRDRHPLDAYGMAAGSPVSYQFSEVGMITLGELERLAKESLWTGDWNASCGTVDCAYSADSKFAGEFDEIAHPVPNGVSDYIAAAQPKAILELVAEMRRLSNLLACRPALNSGLIEAYSQWTAVVYDSEAARAKEKA